MTLLLGGLGVFALLGLNVVLWTWAAGIVREYRREGREPGLVAENARLHAELRRKEVLIAETRAALDRLERQATEIEARVGVYRQ